MADDIVTRLRAEYDEQTFIGYADLAALLSDAAAEIERLRAELQETRLNHITTLGELQEAAADIERLRAAILEWDASTDCFWDDVDSHDAAVQRYRAARAAAVKEARRG